VRGDCCNRAEQDARCACQLQLPAHTTPYAFLFEIFGQNLFLQRREMRPVSQNGVVLAFRILK
jgi:hypothetical protein